MNKIKIVYSGDVRNESTAGVPSNHIGEKGEWRHGCVNRNDHATRFVLDEYLFKGAFYYTPLGRCWRTKCGKKVFLADMASSVGLFHNGVLAIMDSATGVEFLPEPKCEYHLGSDRFLQLEFTGRRAAEMFPTMSLVSRYVKGRDGWMKLPSLTRLLETPDMTSRFFLQAMESLAICRPEVKP